MMAELLSESEIRTLFQQEEAPGLVLLGERGRIMNRFRT